MAYIHDLSVFVVFTRDWFCNNGVNLEMPANAVYFVMLMAIVCAVTDGALGARRTEDGRRRSVIGGRWSVVGGR